MSDRKNDHIRLALESQTLPQTLWQGLSYEPIFGAHDSALKNRSVLHRSFLGKTLDAPLWISSMTGGGSLSRQLNVLFAEVAAEFGLGMGLGSCRPILDNPQTLADFDVRSIIGPSRPLLSNIGHAQLEQMLFNDEIERLDEMNQRLDCDALILHLNPLQEWFQPEGDRFKLPALELIERVLDKIQTPLVVKEVGQGLGPKSLQSLVKLNLAGIEFGAFGGTNFSKLEELRNSTEEINPLCYVGHTAEMMVEYLNQIIERERDREGSTKMPMFIISGGIQNYLHGFKLMKKLKADSLYAQAGKMLFHAQQSKQSLVSYIQAQINGLLIAESFLELSEEK